MNDQDHDSQAVAHYAAAAQRIDEHTVNENRLCNNSPTFGLAELGYQIFVDEGCDAYIQALRGYARYCKLLAVFEVEKALFRCPHKHCNLQQTWEVSNLIALFKTKKLQSNSSLPQHRSHAYSEHLQAGRQQTHPCDHQSARTKSAAR
ncbi:MAG: hypothetical protein H6640_13680 [Caldilineaceae bacterium]|nr:hypothetical protein [Caldilineaceae bacterium]